MNDISTAASLTASPAIALAGVNLSLGRAAARVHILKDIDLNIGRGEAIGLVGPSGSGKTTLLMVLAGLERADTGSIVVADTDLRHLDEDALARFRGRNVGIVFQSFHLIPTMTALENVAVPLDLAGVADAKERTQETLLEAHAQLSETETAVQHLGSMETLEADLAAAQKTAIELMSRVSEASWLVSPSARSRNEDSSWRYRPSAVST